MEEKRECLYCIFIQTFQGDGVWRSKEKEEGRKEKVEEVGFLFIFRYENILRDKVLGIDIFEFF